MSRQNAQRGASLVSVLILIALMSGITVVFLHANRDRIKTVSNQVQHAQALSIAEGLIDQTMFDLSALEQRTNRPLQPPARCAIEGWTAWVEIEDESGKVDLNADDGTLMSSLYSVVNPEGEAEQFRDLVLDFRDADDELRPRGAEAPDYDVEGTAFGIRNGPIQQTDELYQLVRVPAHEVTALLPFVTVHNRSGKVRRSQASEMVRRAMIESDTVSSNDVPGILDETSETYIGRVYTIRTHITKPASTRLSLSAIVEFSTPSRRPIILEWNQVQTPDWVNLDFDDENNLACMDLISDL